jgi:hypothetical protein
MDYWGSRCPALLRASHIIPWSDCNDEQRLDVHNGILLSALWDAAFDQGLVSFADDGTPLIGPKLSEAARRTLGVDAASPLRDRFSSAMQGKACCKKPIAAPAARTIKSTRIPTAVALSKAHVAASAFPPLSRYH